MVTAGGGDDVRWTQATERCRLQTRREQSLCPSLGESGLSIDDKGESNNTDKAGLFAQPFPYQYIWKWHLYVSFFVVFSRPAPLWLSGQQPARLLKQSKHPPTSRKNIIICESRTALLSLQKEMYHESVKYLEWFGLSKHTKHTSLYCFDFFFSF